MNKLIVLSLPVLIASLAAGCHTKAPPTQRSVHEIRMEWLHNLTKAQVGGTAALYRGYTLDDVMSVVMFYNDATKPCSIDTTKAAVLIKYEVPGDDGKPVFGWQLQPNTNDAGCLLKFVNFQTGDEVEGHEE